MKYSSQLNLNDWFVAYTSYVDTLHVYNNLLNTTKTDQLENKDYGTFQVTFNLHTHEPLLFEMKSASQHFGDVDNMDKKHIIKRVKEMVSHNG